MRRRPGQGAGRPGLRLHVERRPAPGKQTPSRRPQVPRHRHALPPALRRPAAAALPKQAPAPRRRAAKGCARCSRLRCPSWRGDQGLLLLRQCPCRNLGRSAPAPAGATGSVKVTFEAGPRPPRQPQVELLRRLPPHCLRCARATERAPAPAAAAAPPVHPRPTCPRAPWSPLFYSAHMLLRHRCPRSPRRPTPSRTPPLRSHPAASPVCSQPPRASHSVVVAAAQPANGRGGSAIPSLQHSARPGPRSPHRPPSCRRNHRPRLRRSPRRTSCHIFPPLRQWAPWWEQRFCLAA
mmetsp:Transcript_174094/g.558180  ORF Transcript_174094/g.558180 Transcript_174094/m.558180 type:complete len:294 (-) Transcript_174094:982-1863(-)